GGRTLDGAADAGPRLAAITLRAGVPVVAGGAVHLRRVRAEAGRRVARPRVVALVGGRALDAGPDAGARLAAVTLRAGVPVVAALPVVAGAAVLLGRVRADAGGRVALPRAVALFGGRALDAGPDAGARLAAVALRAGVPVVAGAAVHLGRVRADAGGRV